MIHILTIELLVVYTVRISIYSGVRELWLKNITNSVSVCFIIIPFGTKLTTTVNETTNQPAQASFFTTPGAVRWFSAQQLYLHQLSSSGENQFVKKREESFNYVIKQDTQYT